MEKFNYVPGEIIKGTVKLKLKKPTKARKFEVAFIDEKIERQTGISVDSTARKGIEYRRTPNLSF